MLFQDVMIQHDVAYLPPDRKEKLDLYLPPERKPGTRAPGIVIIHGGGWTGGQKAAGRELNIGTTLARAGYVCASIEYRLDAHDRWPTNVHDGKNAVRFLRRNAAQYGIDPERLGAIGGSAGGHLALMLGVTDGIPELEPDAPYPGISSGVHAVVDLYGIADIRTWKGGDAVFGDRKPITEADRALASPVEHLTRKNIPPILILHGDRDTTVELDQSRDLDRRLTVLKREHQLVVVPGAGHTFDLQTWNKKPLALDLRPLVVGFFDRHLGVRR